MKELTIEQVEYLAHSLAKRLMEWDEPIPDFTTRFPGKLESCFKNCFQTFGGKSLYPSLEEKAAILFYLMVKNHPFQNGNKRIAVTSLLTFLYINKKWPSIDKNDLYELAVDAAKSKPTAKDGMLIIIRDVIKKNIISVK